MSLHISLQSLLLSDIYQEFITNSLAEADVTSALKEALEQHNPELQKIHLTLWRWEQELLGMEPWLAEPSQVSFSSPLTLLGTEWSSVPISPKKFLEKPLFLLNLPFLSR